MRARPVRLNSAVAWLFMLGSACFVVGSWPGYAETVGGVADSLTYVVGSVFFTAASFGQLVQAQSPGLVEADEQTQDVPAAVHLRAWLPHDRAWLAAATQFPGTLFFNISTLAATVQNATAAQEDRRVWRPDFYGSTLFLVSSVLAILALGHGFLGFAPRLLSWRIAWLNMVGSVLFMFSALGSYVLPTTGELVNSRAAVTGTLLGALCFLVGAALMLPAWKRTVGTASGTPP